MGGKVFTAAALELFRRGPARDDEPPDAGDENNDACDDRSRDAGMAEDGVHGDMPGRNGVGLPELGVENVRGVAETRIHGSEQWVRCKDSAATAGGNA